MACLHDAMLIRAEVCQREQHAAAPHEADDLVDGEGHQQGQVVSHGTVCQQAAVHWWHVQGVACSTNT